jgi:hypothetical protein
MIVRIPLFPAHILQADSVERGFDFILGGYGHSAALGEVAREIVDLCVDWGSGDSDEALVVSFFPLDVSAGLW